MFSIGAYFHRNLDPNDGDDGPKGPRENAMQMTGGPLLPANTNNVSII